VVVLDEVSTLPRRTDRVLRTTRSRRAVRDRLSFLRRYGRVLAVAEGVIAALAVLVYSSGYAGRVDRAAWLQVVALGLGWPATLALLRAYEPRFLGLGSEEYRRVVHAGLGLTACIATAGYATSSLGGRGVALFAVPGAMTATLVTRYGARKWLHFQRRQGRHLQRVLIVGHDATAAELAEAMRREAYAGLFVVGACVPGGKAGSHHRLDAAGVPVIDDLESVTRAVVAVDAAAVAVLPCPELCGPKLRKLGWDLEAAGVDLIVAPTIVDVTGPRIHIRPLAGLPLLHVEAPEFHGFRRVLKEAFDRFAAAIALIVLSPLLLAVAIAVVATSDGGAFFCQQRVGKGGKSFRMYKFRSMYADAEHRLTELLDKNKHGATGVLFKLVDDPRVTPVGRFLRRYSLDELPQLVNVLLGHMSLVGPRPPLAREVAMYGPEAKRRLLVKPGLTGLWQISGRSDLDWQTSVRLDLWYVENWSFWLDLMILWKTAFAVVRGSGAY